MCRLRNIALESVTEKCDRRTDTQTDRQTDGRRNYVSLCFTGDQKKCMVMVCRFTAELFVLDNTNTACVSGLKAILRLSVYKACKVW